MKLHITGLLLALLVAPAALAQERLDPQSQAKTVAPFIDAETVGVLCVDTSRVEIDPLVDKVIELVPEAREDEAHARAAMKAALAEFRAAGGKELYGLFSLADTQWAGDESMRPFLIVPLREGTSEKALSALFAKTGGKVERIGDVLFVGWRSTLERLKRIVPDKRPELAEAFQAAGDATVQGLLLPTVDNRRVVEELLPELPDEIGGGPSTVVTHGLLWAAAGLDGPPNLSLRLVVKSADAEAAAELRAKLLEFYGWMGRQKEVRRDLPTFDRLAELFTPEVQGDRLLLVLNEQNGGVAKFIDAIMLPLQQAREEARRAASLNNLKQIGVAMLNYHEEHKSFPAAASYDADGKPLLSWRVQLLPYLDLKELYDKFHLDEPWDSPHNRKLIEAIPVVYLSPSHKVQEKGRTTYVVPVAEGTAFGGRQGTSLKDFKDGTSMTILVVEVDDDHAVIWTKPDDLPYDAQHPLRGLRLLDGRFNALFGDGSARRVSAETSPETLRALFTTAGGESVRYEDIK